MAKFVVPIFLCFVIVLGLGFASQEATVNASKDFLLLSLMMLC